MSCPDSVGSIYLGCRSETDKIVKYIQFAGFMNMQSFHDNNNNNNEYMRSTSRILWGFVTSAFSIQSVYSRALEIFKGEKLYVLVHAQVDGEHKEQTNRKNSAQANTFQLLLCI